MAAKQVPVAAFPFPALVNETATKQAPVPGSALVNETVETAVAAQAFAVVMA